MAHPTHVIDIVALTGESDISIWANGDFSIWRLQPPFA
jgi:hypothetical protein